MGTGKSERAKNKADFDRARGLYFGLICGKCHRFAGLGGDLGPDLTTLRNKFDQNHIARAIIEPSQHIRIWRKAACPWHRRWKLSRQSRLEIRELPVVEDYQSPPIVVDTKMLPAGACRHQSSLACELLLGMLKARFSS